MKIDSFVNQFLLRMVDEAFDQRSWHGPNLRGSIRGLSAAQAAWRPAGNRHCIAEQVVHTAYWKYVVRRRLLGAERGSFPRSGSNWFPLPRPWTEETWRECVLLLESEHDALRAAVADLRPGQLDRAPAGSQVSNRQLICGIAYHDIYHAGQIQLLKRLQRDG